MNNIPITVILPVKNEEKNLKKCLPLLSDFDQLILIDSHSTDDSVKIAKNNGADVHQFDWNGKFPKKRNWTLRNVTIHNDWVLFLDADEYVTDAFLAELRKKIEYPEVNGYWIQYQTHFMRKKLHHGDKLEKLALFKKDEGEYEKIDEDSWSHLDMEVHEQAEVNGKVGTISAVIDHQDYKGLAKYIDRHNAYSTWEAKHFCQFTREDFQELSWRKWCKYRFMQTGLLPFLFFIGCYFLKLGFLDGKEGFYYAMYKSYYFFQIQTKIVELKKDNSFMQ